MTLSTTESNQQFVGDGIILTFAVTYKVLDTGDLDVYLDNVIQATGFTVVLNPDQETAPGADVTFDVAPALDVAINVLRVVDLTQETDYQPFDAFPADSHETALDRLTMQTQQNAEQISRGVSLPVDTDLDGYDVGEPEADMVVKYRADEQGQESSGINATTFNANVQAAADSAAAALASENKAQDWSEEAEDVPVETGPDQFSAFHWAQKAQAFTDWDQYKDGYNSSTRRHNEYAADLDLILINSKYYIDSTNVTNEPPGFTGLGVIETDMWVIDATQAVQLLTSMDDANGGAAWIRNLEGGAWAPWLPFGSGGADITDTPPANPSVGQIWWSNVIGRSFVYYDDGDSTQWVEQDPPGDAVQAASATPYDNVASGLAADNVQDAIDEVVAEKDTVIYGRTSGAGAIESGTGFTSAKLATGQYRITFDTPFPDTDYGVTVNANQTPAFITLSAADILVGSVVFNCYSAAGALTDSALSFTIIRRN